MKTKNVGERKEPPHKPQVVIEYCYCEECEAWYHKTNHTTLSVLPTQGKKKKI